MSRWQRPPLAPLPWRQVITDRVRRTDPRTLAKRLLVAMLAFLLAQLGWQWREATIELGERQTLVVMERAVPAGAAVTLADVRMAAWPIGLTPEGATTALPANAVAAVDLTAGEVLVGRRLFPAPNGLDVGQRLVTIPQPLAPPPVERGTRVELFGILPIGDGLTSPATRLASGTVMVVTESAISVAVVAAAVPTIVEHSTLGTVEVVVQP